MATIAAARSVCRSASARNGAGRVISDAKAARSPFRRPTSKPLSRRIFRHAPFVETMQPFHTVTASALMTSLLSISRCGYGWLLEACNDDV